MKYLVLTLWLLFSTGIHAATAWSGSVEITQLYPVHSDGLVFLTDYTISLSTCDGGQRFQLDNTVEEYSTQVAVLLAAFMSGKKINMAFDTAQAPACALKINRFRVDAS